MMSKISVVYEVDRGGVMDAHALAPFALAFAGKAAARSLIKLIPGVGSVINASVAVTLTTASGESWRRFCEAVFSGDLDISAVDDAWRQYGSSAVEVINLFVRNRTGRIGSKR